MKSACTFAAVLLLVGFVANTSFAAEEKVLDGKTFTGEMAKEGEKTGDADNFIFKNGTFRSTACDEFGFTAAPYSIEKEGMTQTFKATTKNDKGEKLSWTGSVKGDSIEGEAVMLTSAGKKENYWFKGKLSTN